MQDMNRILIYCLILVALVFACAPKAVKEEVPLKEAIPPEKVPPIERLSPKEQDERAMEVFEQILELTTEPDRAAIIPKMEALYNEIIKDYPESQLAPESYLRLIRINLDDYSPPKIDIAKALYKEFNKKYSAHMIKRSIDDAMARSLYNNAMWKELLEFSTPAVRKYINSGVLEGPFFIFLYSEAKFALGDINEARKGYNIVIQKFPESAEAGLSRQRLQEIQKKK